MFRKLFVAAGLLAASFGAASAADLRMPVKAPIAPVVAVYNWTGFYIGGNAGYSWGRSRTDATLSTFPGGVLLATGSDTFHMDNWIAGGQIGYNWQQANSNWIFGLEADGQASGEKGSATFICGPACTAVPTTAAASVSEKLDWFATFRGRVGYAFVPTAMWYVTGGLAVGEIKSDVTYTTPLLVAGPPVTASAAGSNSTTRAGWTVGTGAEFQLVGNWTGKIEYLYMDLGKYSFNNNFATPGVAVGFTSHFTDNIVRGGINYRF